MNYYFFKTINPIRGLVSMVIYQFRHVDSDSDTLLTINLTL